MKKEIKGFICGITVCSVIFSAGTVFGKTGSETANLIYRNIKIVVDGITVNSGAEPFIMNGSTYLPVREVGEAFGKQVKWDGNSNTVYIGEIPGTSTYMPDIVPAYQSGGNTYKEYSLNKSGGTEYFTMGGIKYTDGMTFNADINIFNDISWAVYNLNSQYSTLNFMAGHVDGTYNGNPTTLQIFCDGQLRDEIQLSPDMIPKQVTVNVSGVNQLKMQVASSGDDGPLYGVGNPVLN